MKHWLKAVLKGTPIKIIFICLYILLLNVNTVFEHVSYNSFFIFRFVKLVVTNFHYKRVSELYQLFLLMVHW